MEIKRILFATDLTENSGRAFAYARTLAELWEAHITLVHVKKRLSGAMKQQAASLWSAERLLRLEEEHKKHVKEILIGKRREVGEVESGRLDGHCDLDALQADEHVLGIRMKEGDPAEQILLAAVEADCDLIVMGAHSRLWGRAVLGSVAQKVLLEAQVPVVVVP